MENKQEHLTKRLKELDCDEKQTEIIIERMTAGDVETVRLLLRRHRKTLMDCLHKSEKKVDDLDLLIYQINKRKERY